MAKAIVKEWEIEKRNPAQLHSHPKNPRVHPISQIEGLGDAMIEFGVTSAIVVDENDQILAGHARAGAAGKKKIEQVPVIVVRGWSEKKKLAFMLSDNRWAELAGWDDALMQESLEALKLDDFDFSKIGFDLGDIDQSVAEETGVSVEFTAFKSGKSHECPKCGFRWTGSSKKRRARQSAEQGLAMKSEE